MSEVEVARRLSPEERDEKARIFAALKAKSYIPKDAAVALGMTYTTLRRRIVAYGLTSIVERNNRRLRRRRENAEAPPAPHEVSRQAQEQRANRERGLCSCGRPPDPLDDGTLGRMCEGCRTKARDRKRDSAA